MTISHNSYFDDGVQSLGFDAASGPVSFGVMAPGEYHFGTDAPERMSVLEGELLVRVDGTEDWLMYGSGTSFDVPGASGFDVRVVAPAAYRCDYLG